MVCVTHFAPSILEVIADLKGCSSSRNLRRGREIHRAAIDSGEHLNIFVASALINMYSKCRSMENAQKVFDTVKDPDVVSWNSLITGYAANGDGETALDLFSQMEGKGCPPNWSTFVAALKACADLASREGAQRAAKEKGKRLHLLALKEGRDLNIFVNNTLVDLFSRCGSMHDAQSVFNIVKNPDIVCWNALISGYAGNGQGETALDLFLQMKQEGCASDSRTFIAALKACIDLATTEERLGSVEFRQRARKLHLLASTSGCDSDIYVQGTLVDMYARFGRMEDARKVFEGMRHQDVVSWNSLISGYVDNGQSKEALSLFLQMDREKCPPNSRTFVAALKACIEEGCKTSGEKMHLLVLMDGCDSHVYVQGTLIDMYARCGCLEEARLIIEKMKHRNIVCWNSLISGYATNGKSEVALELFSRMKREGCVPDARSYLSVIKACTDLVEEEKGKAIHLLSSSSGWDSSMYVAGTLVDMYAKCGDLEIASTVFERSKERDVVCWNVLISGYADHGKGETALGVFTRMKDEGYVPGVLTYIAVFKACLVLGALQTGRNVHKEVISRGFEHEEVLGSCLVDFYAKCGSMAEAKQVFDSQPTKNCVIWTSLITGYSLHGDTQCVISLFNQMLDNAVIPSSVTFLCVLTVCGHAGLVDQAKEYFHMMSTKYGIAPELLHYTCMLDVLGRANKLDEAMVLSRTMPFDPTVVTWSAILAACRKWKNVELATLAFDSLTSLEDSSRAYVQMASIYDESRSIAGDHALDQGVACKLEEPYVIKC